MLVAALLFIAAGFALTVALAWCCALWSPTPTAKRLSRAARWPAPPPRGWFATMVHEARGFGIVEADAIGVIPGTPNRPVQMVGLRAGWPLAAFATEQHSSFPRATPPGSAWRGRVEPPAWLRPIVGRALPVLPIWSGLVADIAIFASGGAMVWSARLGLRAHRRRRRGQCTACGYALTDQPSCPECGRANPRVDSRP